MKDPRLNRREKSSSLRGTAFGLLIAVIAAGCNLQATADKTTPALAEGPDPAPTSVAVVRVAKHSWPATVRVQGSLVSDEEATIGAKIAGRVKKVFVDRGSLVGANQVVAELEPEEFTLKIQQAEAQLAQVRSKLGLKPGEADEKLNRLKAPPVVQEQALVDEARFKLERARLLMRQSASNLEELQRSDVALKVADAKYASALNLVDEQVAMLSLRKAELALAKQHLADSQITAPFAGVIQERLVAPGVFLHEGSPVVSLVRIDPLRFRAGVPEREAVNIQVGEAIQILVNDKRLPSPVKVTRISPALDVNSRTLMIEADVPNRGGALHAGLFAEADIVVDPKAQVLAVPASAVIEFAGVEKVFVVKDQKAVERRIVTGRRDRGLVEVLKDLETGELVIGDARRGRAGAVTLASE